MGKRKYDRETLARWDREHLWHPFTQMRGFREEELLIIARGEGNYLFDLVGNRYLDGVSSLWANLHGHRRPELDRAVTEQLGLVAHSTLLGLAHPSAIVLARRLAQIAPAGLAKVFFSDDGSTAVEVALKLAYQYWEEPGPAGEAALPQAGQQLSRRHPRVGIGGGHPAVPPGLPLTAVRHPGSAVALLLPLSSPG